jgi:hypothetical protein
VVIELIDNPAHEQLLMELYGPMGSAIAALVASYSAAERKVLQEFLSKATAILEEATQELRRGGRNQ